MDRSNLAPLTTWISPATLKMLQMHKASSGLRIQDIVEAALVAHLKKKRAKTPENGEDDKYDMSSPSPLRYPGGKSRALKFLDPYLPKRVDEYREPFGGGLSVAFHVASRYPHASIWINDAYAPLVAFWRVVQDRHGAAELFARISAIKASSDEAALRKANLAARKVLQSGAVDDLTLAQAIYLTNRTAFSALVGTYSPTSAIRWMKQPDDRLLTCWSLMQGWTITCYDYTVLMNSPWSGRDPFLFLDPPYKVKEARLYGFNGSLHQGFDHAAFHAAVHAIPIPTMVTLQRGVRRRVRPLPNLPPVRSRVHDAVESRLPVEAGYETRIAGHHLRGATSLPGGGRVVRRVTTPNAGRGDPPSCSPIRGRPKLLATSSYVSPSLMRWTMFRA